MKPLQVGIAPLRVDFSLRTPGMAVMAVTERSDERHLRCGVRFLKDASPGGLSPCQDFQAGLVTHDECRAFDLQKLFVLEFGE